MENKIVSNFWTAVVSAVVLTATALLLDGNEQAGKEIIFEGAACGFRLGDQVLKTYNFGKTERLQKQEQLNKEV